MLRFSDGVTLDTSGKLRAVHRRDGWYVLGQGCSIPVSSKEEAREVIASLTKQAHEQTK